MRCVIFLSLLALAGCGEGPAADPAAPGSPRLPGAYFDVRGQLDQQVQRLTAARAAVRKQVHLRNAPPETVALSAVKWADELQLFYQADINKTAWRGAFGVTQKPTPGGQFQDVYTRRPGFEGVPVTRLAVTRTPGGQPLVLTADVRQQNLLFFSGKQLRLTFGPTGQLSAYDVQGQQKLLFFDTLRYQTHAVVR